MEIKKDIISPSIDAVTGSITHTPSFYKTTLVVTNIYINANYKKEIFISTPISSYKTGTNPYTTELFIHEITGIACNIYNSNNALVSSPTVSSSNGSAIYKSVVVYGDSQEPAYLYEQYFTNASFTFKPAFKDASDTYRIELVISGQGQWRINTNISTNVRNNSYSIVFNTANGVGYTSPYYNESLYALGKTGQVEVNNLIANKMVCVDFNKTYVGNFNYNTPSGGSTYSYTFPTAGLYLITCGENYNDLNLLDVFYIYAGKGAYTTNPLRYIYRCPLTTITQTGLSSFSISSNVGGGYTSFSVSYQRIN